MVPGTELPAQPAERLAAALGLPANGEHCPGAAGGVRGAFGRHGPCWSVAAQPGGFPAEAGHQLHLLGMEPRLRGYWRHPPGQLDDSQPEQAPYLEHPSPAVAGSTAF